MILLIDNYDSFTYNLYQDIEQLGFSCKVVRNDKITIEEIKNLGPQAIVISPGPGRPEGAGISLDIIHQLKGQFPILGVCLGHQAIAQAFGATIEKAPRLMHGKSSKITHQNQGLFEGMANPFEAMRYHSLVVNKESLPEVFDITATSDDGLIMGIKHKQLPLEGVQFHPESIATSNGKKLLARFLKKGQPDEKVS